MSAIARKANPLRSGISWQFLLIEGIIAIGIGLYILGAKESARRNIVLALGIFLLITGLNYAIEGIKLKRAGNEMNRYRFVAAAAGVATGLVIIVNRLTDFMSHNTARAILGFGLIAIGIATLAGIVMITEQEGDNPRTGIAVTAVVFTLMGAVLLFQAANDTNSSDLIGWTALAAGVALVGVAELRRRRRDRTG